MRGRGPPPHYFASEQPSDPPTDRPTEHETFKSGNHNFPPFIAHNHRIASMAVVHL